MLRGQYHHRDVSSEWVDLAYDSRDIYSISEKLRNIIYKEME